LQFFSPFPSSAFLCFMLFFFWAANHLPSFILTWFSEGGRGPG
jgi:hypothetical protein